MISEKEKCQQGKLYDANNDAELIAEGRHVRYCAMNIIICCHRKQNAEKRLSSVCLEKQGIVF